MEEEAIEGGGDLILGSERNALILRDDAVTLSYSSIRFFRSSSVVIETNASRSSVGNLHRKLTDDPHSCSSFANNSEHQTKQI